MMNYFKIPIYLGNIEFLLAEGKYLFIYNL